MAKRPKKTFPILLDMVTDRVVSRTLTILTFFLVFVFTTFLIVGRSEPEYTEAKKIKFEKKPATSLAVGIVANKKITPLLRVLDNNDDPVSNVTVELQITNIVTQISSKAPVCDKSSREDMVATLEYIRFSQVCQVIMQNSIKTTGELGQVSFNDLAFEAGPQGIYTLKGVLNNGAETDEVKVMMTSPVYSIVVMDSTATIKGNAMGTVGVPFNTMPTVAVYDSEGNPLPNKRVIAFSWPEPTFNLSTASYAFVDAIKYVYFNNSLSPLTNSSGMTTFQNLTALGFTYTYGTYLHFSVDGEVTAPYIENLGIRKGVYVPPHLFLPMMFSTSVASVTATVHPPSSVVEGQPFDPQPVILVTDENGNPLANKMVFAVKVGAKGQIYPANYPFYVDSGVMKDLMYPIPGTYDRNFTNPVKSQLFTPLLTDAEGLVKFTNLSFSTRGSAGDGNDGQVTIVFVCDGVESVSYSIQVESIVSKVEFVEDPPATVEVDPLQDSHLQLVLRILAADGTPIEGKLPSNVTVVPADSSDVGKIKAYMLTDYSNFKPSGSDGTFMLPIRVSRMASSSFQGTLTINATFSITVDSYTLVTPTISFVKYLSKADFLTCTDIEITNLPSGNILPLEINEPSLNISIKTFSHYGGVPFLPEITTTKNKQCNVSVYLILDAPLGIITPAPTSLLSLKNVADANGVSMSSVPIDPDDGTATLYKYKLVSSPKGLIPFKIVTGYSCATAADNTNTYYCTSHTPYYFEMSSDIQYISVDSSTTFTLDDLTFQKRELKTTGYLTLMFTFQRSNHTVYANSPVSLRIAPVQIPPLHYADIGLYEDLCDAMEQVSFSLMLSSDTTDANGQVSGTLALNYNILGFWALAFAAGSASSLPYTFRTDMPVASLQIVVPPSYTPTADSPYIGTGDVFTVTPRVKALDADGNVVPYIAVIALLEEGSGCENGKTTAIMDDYNYGCNSLSYTGNYVTTWYYYGQKYGVTLGDGVADFELFTVLDTVTDLVCVRFVFAVGEPGMLVMSDHTDEFCIKNYYTYSVNTGYSLTVADGQPFGSQPVVLIKRPNWSFNGYSTVVVAAMIRYLDGVWKDNRRTVSSQILEHNICMFWGVYSIDKECPQMTVLKESNPMILQVSFQYLTWTKPTLSSNLRLEFSSMLQEDGVPVTPTIEVVSSPSNIIWVEQPAETVSVGSVFEIQLKATVSDGSPLSRAVIYCSAARNIEMSSVSAASAAQLDSYAPAGDVPSNLYTDYSAFADRYIRAVSVDPSEVSLTDAEKLFKVFSDRITEYCIPENLTDSLRQQYKSIFLVAVDKQNALSLFGQGNVGISYLTSISQRNNVNLESNSDSSRTQSDGLASMPMRFTSGKPDNYTIFCQSGTTFSQKSQTIRLTNQISYVTFENDLSQEIDVSFEKGSDDEIKPTFAPLRKVIRFSARQSDGQRYAGKVYSVEVRMISDTIVNSVHDLVKTNISEFDIAEIQLINSMGRSTDTVVGKLIRFWSIVTTASNAMKFSVGVSEDTDVLNATYTSEGNNIYAISGALFRFTAAGKYRIAVVVNGIESELSGVIKVNRKVSGSFYHQIAAVLCAVVVYALSAILVVANLPEAPMWTPAAGAGVAAFAIELFIETDAFALYFVAIMLVILSLVIVQMLWMLYEAYLQKGKRLAHKTIKMRIFGEYTYTHIYNKNSRAWKRRIYKGEETTAERAEQSWERKTMKYIASLRKKYEEGEQAPFPDEAVGKKNSNDVTRREITSEPEKKSGDVPVSTFAVAAAAVQAPDAPPRIVPAELANSAEHTPRVAAGLPSEKKADCAEGPNKAAEPERKVEQEPDHEPEHEPHQEPGREPERKAEQPPELKIEQSPEQHPERAPEQPLEPRHEQSSGELIEAPPVGERPAEQTPEQLKGNEPLSSTTRNMVAAPTPSTTGTPTGKEPEMGLIKKVVTGLKNVLGQAKLVCTPFLWYYGQADVGEAFYYPQRFFAPLAIGFMALIALLITIIVLFMIALDKLHGMKVNIHKTAYSFVNFAATNAFVLKQTFTDVDLDPVEKVITEVDDYFDEVIVALYVGIIIALVIATIFFLIAILNSMTSFREDVLKLRRGVWQVPARRETFSVKSAMSYSGVIISNFLVGFVVVLFTLGVVFIIISLRIFWEYVYENIWFIVMLLVPTIAQWVLEKVLAKFIYEPGHVYRRPFFSVMDMILSYTGIARGLLSGLVRYLIAIGVLALGISRVDQPLLPNWILKILWLDTSNATYYATVLMQNNHNHPMFLTIASRLRKGVIRQAKQRKEFLRTRNMFHLLRLYITYPELRSMKKTKQVKEIAPVVKQPDAYEVINVRVKGNDTNEVKKEEGQVANYFEIENKQG